MEILTTAHFDRSYKKLPAVIKQKAKIREKIFVADPFDPRLTTHKLHGDKKEEWAYSVDYSHRISFIFLDRGMVLYTDIGTHDKIY